MICRQSRCPILEDARHEWVNQDHFEFEWLLFDWLDWLINWTNSHINLSCLIVNTVRHTDSVHHLYHTVRSLLLPMHGVDFTGRSSAGCRRYRPTVVMQLWPDLSWSEHSWYVFVSNRSTALTTATQSLYASATT